MQLVVDANILVAELLRVRGLKLLTDPSLQLCTTAQIASETAHELRRRLRAMVERGRLFQHEAIASLEVAESIMTTSIAMFADHEFADHLHEAHVRIPQDADDAPTVALALAFDCGIWTQDRDFFGCGLPVWSTEVVRRHLEFSARDQSLNDPPPQ
jgi:predicted nucleic acid-binding protein